MSKFNTQFELSVDDVDVIETALRNAQAGKISPNSDPSKISKILGRIHDQKIFFRPSKGVYVGG